MFVKFIYKKKNDLYRRVVSDVEHQILLLFSSIFWGLLLPVPPGVPERFHEDKPIENKENQFNIIRNSYVTY